MQIKTSRGGRREGSGRRLLGRHVQLTIYVSAETDAFLRVLAVTDEVNISQVIESLVTKERARG